MDRLGFQAGATRYPVKIWTWGMHLSALSQGKTTGMLQIRPSKAEPWAGATPRGAFSELTARVNGQCECPNLVSMAVIKHGPKATWGGRGLFGYSTYSPP